MTDAVPAATVTTMLAPAPGTPPANVATAPVIPAATPAPAPAAAVEPAKPAVPAAVAPEVAPKRLITDAAAPVADPAKPAVAPAADWKLDAPTSGPISAQEVTALEAQAKKLGLSKDQAQAFVTHRTEQVTAEITRTNDLWFEQSNADPEIGGAKMPATVANVQKALGAWATAEERKAIAGSPFANNPLFLRIMNRAAAALPREDAVHTGAPPIAGNYPTTQAQAAAVLYPAKR